MQTKQLTIILLIFCFLLTQFSCAQENQTVVKVENPTMVQSENLKGKVKFIHIKNEDNLFVKVWFDKTGKIVKKENVGWIWDNYVYDDKDRLISVNQNYKKDSPSYEIVNKYINDSIRESYLNGGLKDKIIYKYNKKGNYILKITENNSLIKQFKELIYNKKNQLIEASIYHYTVPLNVWIQDKNGREYEETQWVGPKKTNHAFFEYNELGDISLIKLTSYTKKGINNKSIVTYKNHDEQGNWLEKIYQNESQVDDKVINSIYDSYFNIYETYLSGNHITRTIEYYE